MAAYHDHTEPEGELVCQELVELVTLYLERGLDEHGRARFDAHLAGCAGCRAYLDQMRKTIWLTSRLGRAAR